jgi:WD40 repeat protein/DNA-binding XRE family transcriptional regulator
MTQGREARQELHLFCRPYVPFLPLPWIIGCCYTDNGILIYFSGGNVMEQRLPFHQQLRSERKKRGWSQADLAKHMEGVSVKTIRRWEKGESLPQPYYRQQFIKLFDRSLEELGLVEQPAQPEQASEIPPPKEDWGEAPCGNAFYGRGNEQATLHAWVTGEHCRVIAIVGIGGIGKTSLAAKTAMQVKDSFSAIFWRSLHNAPPLEHFLQQCLQFLFPQPQPLPTNGDDLLILLLHHLQAHHCLLVLDNFESLLEPGQSVGQYREGYEQYGRLLHLLGETEHESCLLLTSREKLPEIAHMEDQQSFVRTLQLAGVGPVEGKEILKKKGLIGSDHSWAALIDLYSGNPLALKLVSEFIQDVFNKDIDRFLNENEEETVFGDINTLVDGQFHRLSVLERDFLYWLAIEREPVTLETLRENLVHPMTKVICGQIIVSLRRRSLIEPRDGGLFTLQPVIMEYVTADLVRRACKDFNREFDIDTNNVWVDFSFMKAQTKDYVRTTQQRLILATLGNHLMTRYGQAGIEQKVQRDLVALRHVSPQSRGGYFAGNVLNLLIHLQSNLRGADFSHVMIRQAYLQNVSLPEVNFTQAHFMASVFTNTFSNILSLAFNPRKDFFAAGTAKGTICVYDAGKGNLVYICEGHTDGVWSLAFNAGGDLMASSSDDGTIRLWEAFTGQHKKTFLGHTGRVRSLDFSPDNTTLASGSDDGTIRLWDIVTGDCFKTLQGHDGRVWAVTFSPEGNKLATGSTDQTVRLWNIDNGECFRVLEGHTGWVRSLAFSPNGHLLASGSDDGTVCLWDVAMGSCIRALVGHTNSVWSVAFNPNGSTLASGSEDHLVRLWEVETGNCLKVQQGHVQGVRSVTFNATGSLLVSGGDDQTIRLWDTTTGHCVRSLQGYTNRVWSAKFSFDGKILGSCGEDQFIRLWDTSTGQCVKTLQDRDHRARDLDFSPDGSLLATGGEDHSVRLWDTRSGRCLRTLTGHTSWLRTVAFSPDGRVLASAGEDHCVRLWDTRSGKCLQTLTGHSSWVRSLAFSPDGCLVASGGDDQTVCLWDARTGYCWQVLKGHTKRVRAVAFHPDGQLIASGGEDNEIFLWERETYKHIKTLRGHTNWVLSVAFSPTGQILASGGDDQTIRLWDMGTGACVQILQDHGKRIRRVDFHPDGNILASCSDDGTIKLWDVEDWSVVGGSEVEASWRVGASPPPTATLIGERPYEGMNITKAQGLTEVQKQSLLALGAVDDEG